MAGSSPTELIALGAERYFIATGPGRSELWRSDGTAAGTVAITTPVNGTNPQDLTLAAEVAGIGPEWTFH